MKKFLLLAGVACLFTANANAANVRLNQYVSGKVSYDWNRDKSKLAQNGAIVNKAHLNDETFAYHVAYGVQAGFVRGEMELNYSNPQTHKSTVVAAGNVAGVADAHATDLKMKINKHSLMFNAYFDFLNCTSWTPYVGAGLGTSWLKAKQFAYTEGGKSKNFDKSTYTLGWQVMAGITYKINSNWAVDAGYRFADLGRIRKHEIINDVNQTAKIKIRDHSALLGIRYTF